MQPLAMFWRILLTIISSRGTTTTPRATESAELESKQQEPCGSDLGTCDPQTPAGHGPVRPHTVTSVRGPAMETEPITDAPSRQDIVDAICYMNGTAKVLRRQGYTGIHGQSYTRIHSAIDGLLYDLAAMDLEASNGLNV